MQKVLVLGGGFGGVSVALGLASSKDHSITLVNDAPYHCYHADLYELVTTNLPHEDKLSFENLISTVNIPLSEIFAGKRVEIKVSSVQTIDLDKKMVRLDSKDLSYDYLVMALGSDSSYFNIPGALEYSHPLKDAADALNLHNDLEELLQDGQKKKIVVAGGGFTGVEVAGNLVEFVGEKAQVVVLEATDHLLGGMPQWAQKKAKQRLESLGVEIRINSPIIKVIKGEIELRDTQSLTFDYLIWTAGVKGVELPGWIKGVQFNPKQQICVQQDLSIKNYPEMFCLGDQSFLESVPPAAWVALEQAQIVVNNILSEKRRDYQAGLAGFVVPIGRGYALSNVARLRVSGLLGWLIKRIIALKYFLSILPMDRAWGLWIRAIRLYPR